MLQLNISQVINYNCYAFITQNNRGYISLYLHRYSTSRQKYSVNSHVNWAYVSNQAVVIGEFYFGKSTESEILPKLIPFISTYCHLYPKKMRYHQLGILNYTENINDDVIFLSGEHRLEISQKRNLLDSSSIQGTIKVYDEIR